MCVCLYMAASTRPQMLVTHCLWKRGYVNKLILGTAFHCTLHLTIACPCYNNVTSIKWYIYIQATLKGDIVHQSTTEGTSRYKTPSQQMWFCIEDHPLVVPPPQWSDIIIWLFLLHNDQYGSTWIDKYQQSTHINNRQVSTINMDHLSMCQHGHPFYVFIYHHYI